MRLLQILPVGIIASVAALFVGCGSPGRAGEADESRRFAREIERVLPPQELYDYHQYLSSGTVHRARRNWEARPKPGELELPETGWKVIRSRSPLIRSAAGDFQDYLQRSMGVRVEVEDGQIPKDWRDVRRAVIVGTREELPGCGTALSGAKDYEITATPERIVVCGCDDRGAMYGLYNVEARMNLREGPFLPADLRATRHSLYETRMILSWMGWMEFPDALLSHLAHDGFDGIFASVYANPNGDRTAAETSTDFYSRLLFRVRPQDPARVRDLIDRAARYGISVYAPIVYQYLGTAESERGLRRLVRDIVELFPEIRGYVLLTEGFWYKDWLGGRGDNEAARDRVRQWTRAVAIVTEECHRLNPAIQVLPWDYNIPNRRRNAELKRYLIRQLPSDTIPLLSWENGKSFTLDGREGSLTDYSISQIGPAEATEAQITEAAGRGMKIYCNADTFVCGGQFQTIPYLPVPYQWHARYLALEKHGIAGTLESWSSGYTPSFMSELRTWFCWTNPPPLEELLGDIASSIFGNGNRAATLEAWRLFSEAIRLVPDTGPSMGTSSSVANPLFFQPGPARAATFRHSWIDQDKWTGYFGGDINPYWPYTLSRLTFYPDFRGHTNLAELYARGAAGATAGGEERLLPVFLKYLRLAAGRMGEGLKLYRQAALSSPVPKREPAVREVVVAEQMQRLLLSTHAILEFEQLRLELTAEHDRQKAAALLDLMEGIVRDEIARTELSLVAAKRDARLGFQFESDYVYTPYSLGEKLTLLRDTLNRQLPAYRKDLRRARN